MIYLDHHLLLYVWARQKSRSKMRFLWFLLLLSDARTTDAQWSLFSSKSQTFGLRQTNWADKFWGIFGRFISAHFGTVSHTYFLKVTAILATFRKKKNSKDQELGKNLYCIVYQWISTQNEFLIRYAMRWNSFWRIIISMLFFTRHKLFHLNVSCKGQTILDLVFFQELARNMLKVSKFQNEFIKSSFLPNYEPKIASISAL